MSSIRLFDTHTHFDVPDFDEDRIQLAYQAKQKGVEKLILIGLTAERLPDLLKTHQLLNGLDNACQSYLAPGLHPIYIEQHQAEHINELEQFIQLHQSVAIGEIGLDRFLNEHKIPEIQQKQHDFFIAQVELAKQYQLPILLHIRKAHAEVLSLLKQQRFTYRGIAHAFSGGVEEAKAFIKMGFKLGVTGQISNPNAKKLRQVVQSVGIEHLVIETDCPDMTPLCCQTSSEHRTRNTPANLPCVVQALAEVLQLDVAYVAEKVWQNSLEVLPLVEKGDTYSQSTKVEIISSR